MFKEVLDYFTAFPDSLRAKLSFYAKKKNSIFLTHFYKIANYILIRPLPQNVSFYHEETHIAV